MNLIPRELAHALAERLVVLQDIRIEEADALAVKTEGKKRSLMPEEREKLAAITSRLGAYRERLAELDAEIKAETEKHGSREAQEARKAARAAVKVAHEGAVVVHNQRAQELPEMFKLVIQAVEDFREQCKAHSAAVEAGVRHLTASDPTQFNRAMEAVVAPLRGFDQAFAEAFGAAICELGAAAQHGADRTKKDLGKLFARAAEHSIKQLDARLPVIHQAEDVDLTGKPS